MKKNLMLGLKLKKIRLEKGYTLAQIGEKMKLDLVTIHKYENGKIPISDSRLIQLAKIYDISMDELLLETLVREKIEKEEENISCERAKQILQEVQDELNEGPAVALMPLRAVLTGKARGADLYTVIKIIGKTRILNRISQF